MYKDEDFDILVKSTLDNGTEEVPAGMWEKIERRLDAAEPAPVVRRPLWKRLAAGMAFACVAVCCVLLLVPHKAENGADVAELVEVVSDDSYYVAETGDDTPEVEKCDEAPAIAPESSATIRKPAKKQVLAETLAQEENAQEETAQGETTQEDTKAPEKTKLQAPGKKENHVTKPADTYYNIFDEPETSVNRIRFSLTGSAMSGGHAGSRSSLASRMSSNQMDFDEGEKIYESANTFYLIPISAGASLRINFTKRWSLGIGLNYTYLKRRFEGSYDYGGTENYFCNDITNDQHYVGIPVNAFYNITTGRKIKFYVYAGGTVEKCVSNSYSFKYYSYDKVLKQSVGGIQASVNAGIGLQFCITDNFGIYLDPSFRYYFRNYLQPKSLRTTQPFQINAELGIRWDL